jgi:hypothetical protein
MVKGEEFVVRELRSRARGARRWWIGAAFLIFGLSVLASQTMRSRTKRPGGGGAPRGPGDGEIHPGKITKIPPVR